MVEGYKESFVTWPYKVMLKNIVAMRRSTHERLIELGREDWIKNYDQYHSALRKRIVEPTTVSYTDARKRSYIAEACDELFGMFDTVLEDHKKKVTENRKEKQDESFVPEQKKVTENKKEKQEESFVPEQKKVTENKIKRGGHREGAGRPAIGDRRTYGIVMPDEEWAKIDLLIDRSGAKPAEFMRDLLRQRIYAEERFRDRDEYGY